MSPIPEDLVEQAAERLRPLNRATPTTLERLLKVHYLTAVALLEELETRGVVGPVIGKLGERRTIALRTAVE